MQDEELSKTYVDSIEIWWSPYCKVTNSMMHSASVWKLSELLQPTCNSNQFLVSKKYLAFSVERNLRNRYIQHRFHVAMGGLELRDLELRHRNAQLTWLGSNDRPKHFEKNQVWVLDSFRYHHSELLYKYITKYVCYHKRYI